MLSLVKAVRGKPAGGREAIGVSDNWRINRRVTSGWASIVERPVLRWVYHYAVFGSDYRILTRGAKALDTYPSEHQILDMPCGSGVLFAHLSPERDHRYVAADISVLMLQKARATAEALGLRGLEFKKADIGKLPWADATFDVVATYHGLQCVPDPVAGIGELARVLRPGGTMQGSLLVSGCSWRSDLTARLCRRLRIFGEVAPLHETIGWLETAGMEDITIERSGGWVHFRGRRSSAA